jgi:hypothetical protein
MEILTLSTRKVPLLDKGDALTFLVPDTVEKSMDHTNSSKKTLIEHGSKGGGGRRMLMER